MLLYFEGESPWLSTETVCDLIDARIVKEPAHPTANLDREAFLAKARAKSGKKWRATPSDARGLVDP